MAFELLDYIVFFGMLCMSAGVGLYYRLSGGKQKTNEEYLLGNREQNPIFVAFSLMASYMSAVSIMGGAAEAYVYGAQFFTINIGNMLGIILSQILFIPTFYRLKTVSMFQYLELRFGYITRFCASLMSTGQLLLYISIALAAPAISLQTITNISREASVISCGFVCLFYAALGGMKAIIITDVIQSVFMFASMFAVIFSGYSRLGSFQQIFSIASERGRINLSNFSIDPTIRNTWLSTVVGGTISGIIMNGISQTQVQRYLTMKNRKTVAIANLSSAPIAFALSICICLSGLTIFAVYSDCDPIKFGKTPSANYILPYYVTNEIHGYGLSGIFAAGIFSAALSTVSPVLNSLAAMTIEDYIKPFVKNSRYFGREQNSSRLSQIFTLLYGITCIVLSLLALRETSMLQAALMVFQLVGGSMLGIFSLGMFTLRANQKGSLLGFFFGIICVGTLCLAPKPTPPGLPTSIVNCSISNFYNNTSSLNVTTIASSEKEISSHSVISYITQISYLLYGTVGFLCTFLVGYVFSLIFGDEQFKVNANLMHGCVGKPLIEKHSPHVYLENMEKSFEGTPDARADLIGSS